MKKSNPNMEKTEKKKGTIREYAESFIVALAIALVIRALVIYPFRIPTGSMKDTLLVGDFLLANKFAYGIRSPDWIGIPYTKIGFKIPFFRTPGFRKPQSGNVVIFKYPRDDMLNYIKRCIAVSGDTVLIQNKEVFVNGKKFINHPKCRIDKYSIYNENFIDPTIFPPGSGNRDNYGPVRVPARGDTFHFTENNRHLWFERLQLALYEGHELTLSYGGESIKLTVNNLDKWPRAIHGYPIQSFKIDGKSINEIVYTVENKHYFMMGDNRDDSLDSRYWGFLPERYVVGEGLIVYWSWDSDVPLYRLFDKIRWKRILNLIR